MSCRVHPQLFDRICKWSEYWSFLGNDNCIFFSQIFFDLRNFRGNLLFRHRGNNMISDFVYLLSRYFSALLLFYS